ncbi:MAG: methyltransferase domain-containing protein [Candidatus Thiodiazotropha sp. (ex Lucinoma borealis)]|nr:methyltransferase domain-containing protein [Candidatus Thiodiazotropha sp. (ex Lucinoma borealis)]
MYDFIHDISIRPEPFSRYTAKELWTRPYLSRQMLEFHLNQETDLASRRIEVIDNAVRWIDGQLDLPGKSLCDLGCGPGLYTQRFAALGAKVTGIDFSRYTLDYARDHSDQSISYIHADYLADTLPTGFDVITLIYTDLCVLSPNQRVKLLGRMQEMLNPEGRIVIDVAGTGLLKSKQEVTFIEDRFMSGFWAAGHYVGIQKSFIYEEQYLALDRYIIVEPSETWQIYNWFQHYTPQMIEAELRKAGFVVTSMVGDLTGAPLISDGDLIGVIASAI